MLVIRADASAEIGSGHVMRCLALAQAWQESGAGAGAGADGRVTLVSDSLPEPLRHRVEAEGVQVALLTEVPGSEGDAAATCRWAQERGAEWIVADGYRFGTSYQEAVRAAGRRLLLIDDYGHAERYAADIVLNQNIDAPAGWYRRRRPETRLLLGTEYALLRREFRSLKRDDRKLADRPTRLLITLGGADSQGVTVRVLEALAEVTRPLEAVAVVGGSNPHGEVITAKAAEMPDRVQVRRDARDIAALMQWADLAVSAGGTTCWELAFLGVPNIIVVLADNQRRIAEGLHRAGVSLNRGWHADARVSDIAAAIDSLAGDPARLSEMSTRGRSLVDGQGAVRVCKAMRKQ